MFLACRNARDGFIAEIGGKRQKIGFAKFCFIILILGWDIQLYNCFVWLSKDKRPKIGIKS